MRLGFTGTRTGMINPQHRWVKHILSPPIIHIEFHHGDCTGADAQAHDIAAAHPNIKIYVHPPSNTKNRAYCKGHVIHGPFPYLTRNEHITNDTERLIATPKGMTEEQRSGTWHAIRYAIRIKRPVLIIQPNGNLIFRNSNSAFWDDLLRVGAS